MDDWSSKFIKNHLQQIHLHQKHGALVHQEHGALVHQEHGALVYQEHGALVPFYNLKNVKNTH